MTYDTRTTFRRLRARATLAAGTQFRRAYYGRQVRPADRREPPRWASVPGDYDVQIRALRCGRCLDQLDGQDCDGPWGAGPYRVTGQPIR